MDYHIIGTALRLRFTDIGQPFTRNAVEEVIDAAIHRVVGVINAGYGRHQIDLGRFSQLSDKIDLRINAHENAEFTNFMLGKPSFSIGGGNSLDHRMSLAGAAII